MNQEKCYLCESPTRGYIQGGFDATFFDCSNCGHYAISRQALCNLESTPDIKLVKARIAAIAYERNMANLPGFCIGIESSSEKVYGLPIFSTEDIVRDFPDSIDQILDRSLLNLSRGILHPADMKHLSAIYPQSLFCFDSFQMEYVMKQLQGMEYISAVKDHYFDKKTEWRELCILPKGWQRINELKKRPAGNANQAFVAMWFNPQMDPFFDNGIRPAVEHDKRYKCVRIDLGEASEHNDKICDRIIAEIRKSTFLIADFTGNRGGVYYEAGFALGLGLPVIYIGQYDWFFDESGKPRENRELHFDTRQYNHIFYTSPEDLKEKLIARIQATIL
jgi:nucleoside 2-deoxyribosyltransferase/predicted RNA-binding Zn-ribbon protein involved in translation (DUF1610 family)